MIGDPNRPQKPRQKALLLVHRIPYPPDKGDKIRSWRLVQFLAARFDLALGFFVDDPADMQHVPFLETLCSKVKAVPLSPRLAKLKSLTGFFSGKPLSFQYYASREMAQWVAGERAAGLDVEMGFSSQMAPFLDAAKAPVLIDLCDADSAKWQQYAQSQSFPMSWIYRREGKLLAAAEASISRNATRSFFITDEEATLVRGHPKAAPEKIDWYMNGVDTDYFDPAAKIEAAQGAADLVFVGAMDYQANVAAVQWFVRDVWPLLRRANPALTFAIVGSNPGPEVRALSEQPGIQVTGRVADVRSWLRAAKISVAPLQIARGVQNKVLEAMAMGLPVVATSGAATGIRAQEGRDFVIADEGAEMAREIESLLNDPVRAAQLGASARELVRHHYGWEAQLARLERALVSLKLV